ncbi:MAG: SDR family oxidoreductase [Candidatus Diapherotrites archaeon]|nr:SDR family oxidoreductase [Candidatus Diapherotrites archaeon]
MKMILVSGGAGFIGSHLCERLLADGNRVICVDNFVTGRKENVLHLLSDKNFSLVEHDITEPLKVKEKICQIFNLASPASPVDFEKIPLEILAVNSAGTGNMLELAAEKKARFLQASTSEVYGDPLEHPQRETYWGNVNPNGPRSCYDEGKRFSEALAMAYSRARGVDVRIARIFNTYGPRMRPDDGRVVPNFIMQALHGKPLTVYGRGEQTRSFCYVSDMVDGLVQLMESDYSLPVNLGNPCEFTVLRLAEEVIKICGSSSKISFKQLPKDDPTRRKPDISVAKRELGWEPEVQLHEGLQRTIDWFKPVK